MKRVDAMRFAEELGVLALYPFLTPASAAQSF